MGSDDPRTTYFRFRLVRKGPWVGVAIVPDPAAGLYWLDVDGVRNTQPVRIVDVDSLDPAGAMGARVFHDTLHRVLMWGEKIDQAEHDYLVANAKWARANRPDDPAAQPGRPISLRAAPPLF